LEERLFKQIDEFNVRVNKDTINSNIENSLSEYVTYKADIQGTQEKVLGKGTGSYARTKEDWETLRDDNNNKWEKEHLSEKVTDKPDI